MHSTMNLTRNAPADRAVAQISLYQVALVFVASISLVLVVVSFFLPYMLFSAVGMVALSIMLVPPAVLPRYDIFSPWSFATLCVILGLVLRGICISSGFPNRERIDGLFLLGERPDFFVWPAVVLLGGLSLMAVGYLSGRTRLRVPGRTRTLRWNTRRLYLIAFFALVVSMVSNYFFVRETGGFESEHISAKRDVIGGLDVAGSEYRGRGTLRLLAALAIFAHLLVLADSLRSQPGERGLKLAFAAALFLSACVIPVYASNRTPIALYSCLSAALFCYSGRSFPFFRVAALVAFAISGVYVMTVLRAQRDDKAALSNLSFGSDILESVVINRNYIGLCKTGHIVDAIPDTVDFQYGQTIWIWLAAPIPREIWPEKPMIHSGPILGIEVFGTHVSGIPPSFVAEMYWNFHLPGVVLGCFLFGWGLRYLHERFRPQRGGDPFIAAAYVAGPMQLGYVVLGDSVGYGIFQTAIALSIMGCLLWFLRDRRQVATAACARPVSLLRLARPVAALSRPEASR